VIEELIAADAFPTLGAAVRLKKEKAKAKAKTAGRRLEKLNAKAFVKARAGNYYKEHGVSVEFSIPKDAKVDEGLLAELKRYQGVMAADMARGGYNYRGAGTKQTIEQFFNNYFRKEWYDRICQFVNERFSEEHPLKAIVTNGIGANDQFMWSLINMYNAKRPDGAPKWYHIPVARDLEQLRRDGIQGKEALFIDISRSGGTWEGVEVAIRSLQMGYTDHLALANGGAIKAVAEKAAKLGQYKPLIIGMSPDIGGRNMHRKTTIYYTAQTVAGMFLSWMNSNVFAEFNDAFDKANDFAEPDNSLAVSAGQFLQGTMETLDVNHIAFITNTEALRLVGTEWEQYIMEGCNKEHVISMGMHDLATEPEDVLQNFSRTRLARQTVSIVILDRSALSYETDRMRVAALAETTPLMIFTVETMFGRGINIEQQAAFDILWTDLVTVFTTLLRVDANSNPNVKFVREYTAMRVAEWRTAEGKYKDDAIGRGEAEVLVSMGNPKQPKIGSEGSQVALTKDNAANKGKEMAEALLSSGMLSDRNRLNLFVGRDDLRPITKDMREYAYSVLCPEGGAGWVTQTALFPLWSHKGLEANLAYSTDPAKPLLANKTINIFFNARSLGAGETYSQAFQSMGILGNKYDGINGATVAQTNDAMTLPNVIRMAEVSPTILLEFNDRTVSTEEVIRAFTKAFIDRLAAEQPAAAPTKGTERTMDASVPGSLGAVGLSPAGTTAAEAAKVEVKKTQSPGDLAYSAIRTALNKNKTEVEKKGGVGIGIARQVIGRALDMLDGSRTITVIIEELRRGERDLRLLQSTEGYNDRQKKEIESAAGILADSANDIGSVVKFDLTVPNLPSSPFRLSAELGENLLRRLLKGGLEGRITVYDNQNTSTMRIGLYRGSSIMLYAVNNGRTEDLFINPSDEFVVLKDGHIAYIKAGTDKIGLLFDGWPFNNIPASSVISASFLNLPEEERAAKAASAVKTGRALNQEVYVHVDVIYGNESKGTRIVQKGVKKDTYEALKPDMVKQIRNECRKLGIDDPCIDVHLMLMEDMLTADNSKLIRDYIDNGAGIVTLHWEAFESKDALLKCLRYIHSRNVKAGLALNPDVNIDEAVSFIGNNKDCIDMVLQMTVSPGLPGQVFNEKKTAEANLGRIREIFKGPIQVDGGINETTLNENPWLKTADIFVAGSAFFNDKPMDETCGRLRTALERIKSGPPSVETPAAVPAEGTVTKMDASGPGKLPAVGLSPAGTTAAQAAPAAAEPATSMAQFEFTLDRNELYRMIGSNMSLHIALSILASKLSKVWAEDDDGDMIVSICNRDIHNNSLSSDAPLDINDTTIPARAVAENVLRSSVVRLTGKSHLPIYILLTAEDVPVLYTGDWDMDVGGLKGYDVAVASGITISDVDKIIKLIPARETNVRASWVAFGERLASALVVPTTPAPAAAAPRTAAEMRAAILRILLEARDEIIQGFHYYKEKALGAISQASSQISGLVPLAEAVITLEGTASELSQTKVGTTYSTEELNDRKHFRNILIKTADKVRGLLTTDLGVTNKPSRPIWMSAEKGVALVRMLLEGGLEGRICRYGSESSSLVWVGPRRHNEKLYTVNEHAHAIKDLDIKPGDAFVVLTDGSIGFVPASTKKEGEVLVCSENNYIRYADTAQLSADGRKFIEINEASDNEIGALTAAPVAVSAPMKGIERTMDASGPGRLPAVGRSPGGTAEEMTLENRIAKAAKALDMSYASIEDAIRSSINKRKFLDDIAESVGITAAAALEIMEKTGIAVVTDRAKREYTIVSNFSRKDKLENLRLALIRASSNPAMVDLSIERITRIILDLIDMEIFISLLSSAAEISPANVVLKLAAQDAFPTLTTASAAAEPTTQAPAEHPLITAIKEAEIEDLVLPNLAGVGPGSVSLDQANRQDAYNTATMVKKSKVEVFVDGTIGLTQTMKDALKDMKQRNRNVSHEEFPTMDHLRELLEKKTEDGVQRIILLQAETSKAITQLAEQSPELFKNVRLVNMKLPDKYDTMAAREKTFVQSRMVMTAILARLYEKDKTPAVERVLKAMVDDDKLADSKGRKFFEGLEETADEATDPAKIRDRVQGCVERVISLMARIALDMERIRLMLQTIWTAA
jgi:ribulose-phosphate 3-epimerase